MKIPIWLIVVVMLPYWLCGVFLIFEFVRGLI